MKERAGGGVRNAIITAEVRYSPVTKQYWEIQHNLFVFVVSSYFENRNQVPFERVQQCPTTALSGPDTT